MKLGIVGLPNVGKSTLFNAITNAGAESANYPFCTIEPNVGVVAVPDARLDKLAEMYQPDKKTPAVIEFVDIAGLVKGASQGAGLGNKFLENIRRTDAIVHVVRCFDDENIMHVVADASQNVPVDPLGDIGTIDLELIMADLEMVNRRVEKATKAAKGDKKFLHEAEVFKALAAHLEVSVITVKNAYEQLMAEGYLTGVEKKGYFVSSVLPPLPSQPPPVTQDAPEPGERTWFLDLVTNSIDAEDFPFTVWARLMRQTILEQGTGLLHPTPPQGAWALRRAIADHLRQFRGMAVGAEQIIVGAGTEVLYSLLVQLLGREPTYGVEDPGYGKIARIYRACGASVAAVPLDGDGLSVQELRRSGADVVHISPSHHYPTGRVMPITRRQELLRWAQEKPERIILEDDYDSEFRFVGRPIPTLFSVDDSGQVVYLNTFSKTIAPSIRISFMVLPRRLLADFRQKLGFYACTVSAFEQYTLAQFLSGGWYEKHLSRMRKHYRQKRDAVIAALRQSPLSPHAAIAEEDAGLHFLLRLDGAPPDDVLRRAAEERGIRLAMLSDYYQSPREAPQHVLVVNYTGIDTEKLPTALARLAELWPS